MGWIVLHVKPRTEKRIEDFCRKTELSCYLPLRQETKLYQRRKVTVQKPLFPGYFFCNINNQEQRKTVLSSNYALRIMEPPSERELKRTLVSIRKALRLDPSLMARKQLTRGTRVRITAGPLMGTEGSVDSIRGAGRIFLEVEMIGQGIAVEVDPDWIDPI
jgi:transcription antitermination factor NusG